MPITAVLHTHILVVILFLILFIIKAFLLFTNKHQTLEKIKKSTKIFDIIFGVLILVTGAWLLSAYNGIPTWLIAKIVLVLAGIPVSIIGIKKHNKMMTALGLIIFIYVYGIAESKNLTMRKDQPDTANSEDLSQAENNAAAEQENTPAITSEMSKTALANAHSVYMQNCTTCHGEDGKKGLNNATDFSASHLTLDERKAVILNGRGLMPAYQGQLSEQEAEELAAYTQMLK